MALATKNKILVANWRPKIGNGDQKQISSSQLADNFFSQWRALYIQGFKLIAVKNFGLSRGNDVSSDGRSDGQADRRAAV